MYAAQYSQLDAIRLLLGSGADKDAVDNVRIEIRRSLALVCRCEFVIMV